MPAKRAFTGGKFTLELDQRESVGFVNAIDGGHFKSAGQLASMVGADNYVTKYSGKPQYDDITITVGTAMSPAFWKWVQASLDYKPQRRNGALVGYDFNLKERTRRSFYGALIAEIAFPALDASTKTGAALNIKITPERMDFKDGDGSDLKASQAQNQMAKQKMWLSSNFRFELDKFKGDATLRNCKIDSFTVKQNVITNPIGTEMDTRREVGRLELPNLVVTFPESGVKPWMDWFDKAVAKGNRADQLTTGFISYLAGDGDTELLRIDLGGISLLSLEIDKYEAGKESIANVKATLNVETMALKAGEGTI